MKLLKKYIIGALCIGAMVACEKEEIQTADQNNTTDTKQVIGIGQGGSMAQFTIVDDYLYTVDYRTLHIFHIANSNAPEEVETIDLGVGIETIYPQDGYLFIGSQNGVNIYDISNPRSPVEVSEFNHVTSCDPVVASGNFAIATLRGGTECGGNLNEFDLFDISDIYNPTVIKTEQLSNPYGVGFSSNTENLVYVCDGVDGLKAYDITNPELIEQVMYMTDLEAIDVIPAENNQLIVLCRNGIYQFDSSDPVNLVQKSFIPAL